MKKPSLLCSSAAVVIGTSWPQTQDTERLQSHIAFRGLYRKVQNGRYRRYSVSTFSRGRQQAKDSSLPCLPQDLRKADMDVNASRAWGLTWTHRSQSSTFYVT